MTLSASIQLQDRISAPLQSITRALNITISTFEHMNRASASPINTAGLASARNELAGASAQLRLMQENIDRARGSQNGLNQNIREASGGIRDAEAAQRGLNNEINRGSTASGELMKNLKRMAAVYLSIRSIGQVINLSDKMTQIEARLNLTVDEGGSTSELDKKIFESAQRAKASYIGTADIVSKLGQRAGNAFANNDETIQFAENLQKQFAVAGASQQEMYSANLQLTQALGSGVLRGQEFNAVFEAAPNVIQTIADYLDMPIGKMRNMASEGLITADIVKNAMLGATDKINSSFDSMPLTFGQVWQVFKNEAVKISKPILLQLRALANSEEMAAFSTGVLAAFTTVGSAVSELFSIIGRAGAYLHDNWSSVAPLISGIGGNIQGMFGIILNALGLLLPLAIEGIIKIGEIGAAVYDNMGIISPVLYGLAAGMGVYMLATKGAVLATTAFTFVQKAGHAISVGFAAVQGFLAIGFGVLTGNATASSAAVLLFNSSLMACPIVWIIFLIIALVTAIYVVIGAINKWKGTTTSATGWIMGKFFQLGAYIFNQAAFIQNIFADASNFIANCFNDPVAAVKILFYDMAISVIGYITDMAKFIENVINKIPGVEVNITSGLESFKNTLTDKANEAKTEADWKESVKKWEHKDYGEAKLKGIAIGEGVDKAVKGFFDFGKPEDILGEAAKSQDLSKLDLSDKGLAAISDNVKDIAGNTKKVADSDVLNKSQDHLELIKTTAERNYMDKTVTIKVDMINNNSINSEMDIDGIVNAFASKLEEQLAVSAEGVHI